MDYNNIVDFIFENIKKIAFPEEWLSIDSALSKQELFAMMMVDKHGEIIMSQIADYVNVPMSTATGIVDRLVKSGFMDRKRSDTDRRIVVITLTEKGANLICNIKNSGSEYIKRIYDVLTEDERDMVFRIFTKVMGVINGKNEDSSKDYQDNTRLKKIEIE